jgi:hypothetical protein
LNLPLFLGAGVIRTTAMIDLRGTRTVGAGMQRTVIMSSNTTDAVVLVGGGAMYLADMTVQHFARPDSATVIVPNGVGIRVQKLQDRSVIERVQILNVTAGFYSYEPYDDATNYIFSSSIRDCRIDRFSHSAMYLRGSGAGNTGCVISNIYAQNGNGDGTYNTAAYGYFFSDFNEGFITQLNCEWGYYGVGVTIGESNLTFGSIHFEQYRAKGASFSSYFNIYGSNSFHNSIEAVTLKDCIYDQANVVDYAFLRVQSGTNVKVERVISTGGTVIGTVTRRWVIFENDGARVFEQMWRQPDATFGTADYYSVAPAAPHRIIARGPLGTGDLYVESGALKYRGSAGTITTLAVT